MDKLKVRNHKHFAAFDYEQSTHPDVELGDVIFRDRHPEFPQIDPEIGVVIQTFDDRQFRTDMWGNTNLDPTGKYGQVVTFATLDQVREYRPKLVDHVLLVK